MKIYFIFTVNVTYIDGGDEGGSFTICDLYEESKIKRFFYDKTLTPKHKTYSSVSTQEIAKVIKLNPGCVLKFERGFDSRCPQILTEQINKIMNDVKSKLNLLNIVDDRSW